MWRSRLHTSGAATACVEVGHLNAVDAGRVRQAIEAGLVDERGSSPLGCVLGKCTDIGA
jgi:hypothetical protein